MKSSLLDVIVTSTYVNGQGNLSFLLSKKDGEGLPPFEPGAHIDVHLPDGLIRQYSLCGPVSKLDAYEICVRLDDNSRGGSLVMHRSIEVGSSLQISIPRNNFPLPQASRYLLFAGGIGITPLITMMEAIRESELDVELHYYTSSISEVAFLQRLQSSPLNSFVFLHHSETGGTLRKSLPTCLAEPNPDAVIVSCGPNGFMSHLKDKAILNGWTSAQFYSEKFHADTLFSDEPINHFQVQIASTGQQFLIPEDKSIAAVLMDHGFPLELSCEQGICGACLTSVTCGIPDHRDSVQSEEEKTLNNQMTLCCSRAKSELLVLDL